MLSEFILNILTLGMFSKASKKMMQFIHRKNPADEAARKIIAECEKYNKDNNLKVQYGKCRKCGGELLDEISGSSGLIASSSHFYRCKDCRNATENYSFRPFMYSEPDQKIKELGIYKTFIKDEYHYLLIKGGSNKILLDFAMTWFLLFGIPGICIFWFI